MKFDVKIALAVVACLTVARAEAFSINGSATLSVVASHCSADASARILGKPLGTGQAFDMETGITNQEVHLPQIKPGRYWIFIQSGSCRAHTIVSFFPALARNEAILLREAQGKTDDDIFVAPLDSLAVQLPYTFMSVDATMVNGVTLPVQVVGRYAFIDNIPRGSFKVHAAGLNFSISGTFSSAAANRVSVHALDRSSNLSSP